MGPSTTKAWRHIDFQDGGRQPCCICLGVMADHPRSAFRRLNSILKSLVRRINSSGDIAMYRFWRFGLKLPIHAHFGGVFGAYFTHMTSPIVVTLKRTVFGRKHVIWAIQCKNRCNGSTWARDREKNTGQQKSHKNVIFPYLGEAPTGPIRPKSCMVGNIPDVITCAKFQIEIFMGYDFTGGWIFDFPIDFSMGLTTNALPVTLWNSSNAGLWGQYSLYCPRNV